MKIIQNTLKIQKRISNVSKQFWVGPKRVGSVGFPETRHFWGGGLRRSIPEVYSNYIIKYSFFSLLVV